MTSSRTGPASCNSLTASLLVSASLICSARAAIVVVGTSVPALSRSSPPCDCVLPLGAWPSEIALPCRPESGSAAIASPEFVKRACDTAVSRSSCTSPLKAVFSSLTSAAGAGAIVLFGNSSAGSGTFGPLSGARKGESLRCSTVVPAAGAAVDRRRFSWLPDPTRFRDLEGDAGDETDLNFARTEDEARLYWGREAPARGGVES